MRCRGRVRSSCRIVAGPVGMFRHGKGGSEYRDIFVEENPKGDMLLTVR